MIRIHAIRTGSVAVKENQRVGKGAGQVGRQINILAGKEWTEPLPIYAWVIEHPEGVIVIDTGETARTAERGYFPAWHPYFKLALRMSVRPDDEIGPQLRTIGISPDDVRWVVLTHMHTDHAGGLAHFPKSEILVARGEYGTASSLAGRINGFLPTHWPEWFSPRLIDFTPQPFSTFPMSLSLTKADNVFLVPTNGHTAHHLSVIVQDEGTSIFFAGDTSYTEQLMLDQVVDGVSPNAKTARQTLARIHEYIQTTPTVYLPSHDPKAVERLTTRQVAVLPAHQPV